MEVEGTKQRGRPVRVRLLHVAQQLLLTS